MAAGGKHGAWRKVNADASRLFRACPWHRNTDKSIQDCESWCRPLRSPSHCSTCKCSACSACHGSRNSSIPSEPSAQLETRRHFVTRRLRKGMRLCLAAYRKDLLDGSPLTFASCRPHVLKSQQHWTLTMITMRRTPRLSGTPRARSLCHGAPHAFACTDVKYKTRVLLFRILPCVYIHIYIYITCCAPIRIPSKLLFPTGERQRRRRRQ